MVTPEFGQYPEPHLGHRGLFADLLDRGYGELTRLQPGGNPIYHVRNRAMKGGRFLQRDPNGLGLPVLWIGYNGVLIEPVLSPPDLAGHARDGLYVHQYTGSNPVENGDPMGLFFGPTLAVDMYTDYNSEVLDAGMALSDQVKDLLGGYSFFQQWDLMWADDWSQPDWAHSRGAMPSPGDDAAGAGGFADGGPIIAGRGPVGRMMRVIRRASRGSGLAMPSFRHIQDGLRKAQIKVGSMPRGKNGAWGPQWGDKIKGYRLEPPHLPRKGEPILDEHRYWHINWYDWTKGKALGRKGVIPIKSGGMRHH